MEAGKRDRLVTIQKTTETQPIGEVVASAPIVHARWWAEKLPLGGGEGPAGGQVQYATRRNEWRGLWIDGVTEKMVLNEDGVLHDIELVDTTGRRQNRLSLVTMQKDTA